MGGGAFDLEVHDLESSSVIGSVIDAELVWFFLRLRVLAADANKAEIASISALRIPDIRISHGKNAWVPMIESRENAEDAARSGSQNFVEIK